MGVKSVSIPGTRGMAFRSRPLKLVAAQAARRWTARHPPDPRVDPQRHGGVTGAHVGLGGGGGRCRGRRLPLSPRDMVRLHMRMARGAARAGHSAAHLAAVHCGLGRIGRGGGGGLLLTGGSKGGGGPTPPPNPNPHGGAEVFEVPEKIFGLSAGGPRQTFDRPKAWREIRPNHFRGGRGTPLCDI